MDVKNSKINTNEINRNYLQEQSPEYTQVSQSLDALKTEKSASWVREENDSTVEYPVAPEAQDGYQPQFSNKYPNNNGGDNSAYGYSGTAYQNIGNISIVDLLSVFSAQQTSIKVMSEVHSNLTLVLQQVSKDLLDYATDMTKFSEQQHVKQLAEMKENQRMSGGMGLLMGLLEAILCIVSIIPVVGELADAAGAAAVVAATTADADAVAGAATVAADADAVAGAATVAADVDVVADAATVAADAGTAAGETAASSTETAVNIGNLVFRGFGAVNGLIKAGAGTAVLIDPSLASKGECSNLMQNGIFAALGPAASTAQQVISMLMLLGGSPDAIKSNIMNFAAKSVTQAVLSVGICVYHTANTIVSMYGMVSSIINSYNPPATLDADNQSQVQQIACMGVAALTIYGIMNIPVNGTTASKAFKEKSEIGDMAFEMLIMTAASIGSNFGLQKLNEYANIKSADVFENSNFRNILNKLMMGMALENSFNQASTGVQTAVKASGARDVEQSQADIEYKQAVGKVLQQILNKQYSSLQQLLSNNFSQNEQGIAKDIQEFLNTINDIINTDGSISASI